jgi:hypothetical protein
MAMSRKHYEAVAASLKGALEDGKDRDTVAYMAGRFLVVFGEDNPRFDGERFILATGLCG